MNENVKETRIIKWKTYRQEILENINIDKSIINSDNELKKMLNKLNLDIDDIFDKSNKSLLNEKNKSYKQEIDFKNINEFLDQINKNENMKMKNTNISNFNSHKYDLEISKNFPELQSDDFSDTATTDLKIKKINI